MRYEDKQTVGMENNEAAHIEESMNISPMDVKGDEMVDMFQKIVYDAGAKVINDLSEKKMLETSEQERVKAAKKHLEQLRDFRYNIGFAGPQSCGKSSLINAIIKYPLMPTCNLATTCTPVELIYSKEIRVTVKDDDRNERIVFDKKCSSISYEDFERLKNYACRINNVAVIENLQYFSDIYIFNAIGGLEPDKIHMDYRDPRQTALLMLILFTVYVNQNKKDYMDNEKEVIRLRKQTFAYWGIPEDIVNYRVIIQWDNPLLESGLMITDLPGLGSSAGDLEMQEGVVLKGHDTITKEAVSRTDTMVFISEPTVLGAAVPVLEAMISNANLRETVSVNECIVAVMNKVDCFNGIAAKNTAIDRMRGMMSDVGVDMTEKKVWETVSLYGEYAYDAFPPEKMIYVQRHIRELVDDGYDEEDIRMQMNFYKTKLKKGYKSSGIDELREFFRKSFISIGKYRKISSVIAAMQALSMDLTKPIQLRINTYKVLSGVNCEIAEVALEDLQEKANTPLNAAIEKATDEVNKKIEEAFVVKELINATSDQYVRVFDDAVNDYIERLKAITMYFEHTFVGFGNRARVDMGHPTNHKRYEELLDESRRLNVDLKDVNKSYADVLRRCSDDIEEIYRSMQERLKKFREEFPGELNKCIDEYREKADAQITELLEGMVPVLADYVDAKIKTADANIMTRKEEFHEVSDRLTNDIIELNSEHIQTLVNLLRSRLNTVEGGWFVKKDYLQIDGDDGLNVTIAGLKLNENDKETLKKNCGNRGDELIVNQLTNWYTQASVDTNKILTELLLDIAMQFKKIKDDILQDAAEKDGIMQQNAQKLNKLICIFDQMYKTILGETDKLPEGAAMPVEMEKMLKLEE